MSWLTALTFEENQVGQLKTALLKNIYMNVEDEQYTFTFTTIHGEVKAKTHVADFEKWKKAVSKNTSDLIGSPIVFDQPAPFEPTEKNTTKATNNPSHGAVLANTAKADSLN